MKPNMSTFALPVSPSHVATAAGIALVQLIPHLRPEPKGILTAAVVGVYVIGETIYSSISSKKLELPAEIEARIKAELDTLEGK